MSAANRQAVRRINHEIRVRWTGDAHYDAVEASWAIRAARRFAVSCLDRKPGFRNCVIYDMAEPPGGRHAYIYWTKARAVVIRIHQEVGR